MFLFSVSLFYVVFPLSMLLFDPLPFSPSTQQSCEYERYNIFVTTIAHLLRSNLLYAIYTFPVASLASLKLVFLNFSFLLHF